MSKACITPVFQRQLEQMRNIRNLIFDNDAMGELPPLTRLLFAGLWTMVDDKGRMEDNPRKIKKVIMGFDDVSAGLVDEMLQNLHDRHFIVRYSVNGSNYIQVNNFSKYRNRQLYRRCSQIQAPEFQ